MLTHATNTPEYLTPALAQPCSALITRQDGRLVDTSILWSPTLPTLSAALDLFVALALSDGEATISL